MKSKPEYAEGTEAQDRFGSALRKVLSVSRAEVQSREAEYRKQSEANPNRPGPKKKWKPTA